MMPCPLPIFSQSDNLIQVVDINLHTEWQTVQIRSVGFFRSQLIWIYTVCQNRVYPGSAGQGLRSVERHGRFLMKENTFVTSCLFSCTPAHSWKGSTRKRKNFLPRGVSSLTTFHEGAEAVLTGLSPLKIYSFPLSDWLNLHCSLIMKDPFFMWQGPQWRWSCS